MNDKKFLIIAILILIILVGISFLNDNSSKNNSNDLEKTYLYTEKELDIYEKYITENFGEIETVFHEIVSPDIHLDILVIAPTKEENYYKLITMGMGAYKMNVPSSFKKENLFCSKYRLYKPIFIMFRDVSVRGA